MSSSWKIGAVSGVVAGIVAGIVTVLHAIHLIIIGNGYWSIDTFSATTINQIASIEIPLNIIWCTVLGIIYSKVYDLVPGKGVSKGLIFGLIYCLIYPARWVMFNSMYGLIAYAHNWFYYCVVFIPLGLTLGITYEFLKKRYIVRKEEHVLTYDIKSGIYPGAFAGLVGGIVVFISLLFLNKTIWPMIVADINFLVSQLGTQLMFNMIWGIVFSILFVRFYEKIPGKEILKGLIFGMIVYFFTTFQMGTYALAYLFYGSFDWGIAVLIGGFLALFPFSLVLGFLYKKPGD